MMNPSGEVRTILTPALLPFDSPFMFRIHPFKELFCGEDPRVNLAMNSARIYHLIVILGSKVTLSGLISVAHFVILLLTSGFL